MRVVVSRVHKESRGGLFGVLASDLASGPAVSFLLFFWLLWPALEQGVGSGVGVRAKQSGGGRGMVENCVSGP